MPYDENLILHGVASGGAHLDMDENCVVPVLLAVNATGDKCLDIRKTPVDGLVVSLVLTEDADVDSYTDDSTITIEHSDHLNRGWATLVTFPILHSHIKRIFVEATVAFVAGDIGGALTSQDGDTGILLAYDDALETVGGQGYVYCEMDLATDYFDDAVLNTCNATTGESTIVTQCLVAEDPLIQMQPKIYSIRFSTQKRYIRANTSNCADSQGICWILLTNDAPNSPTPF